MRKLSSKLGKVEVLPVFPAASGIRAFFTLRSSGDGESVSPSRAFTFLQGRRLLTLRQIHSPHIHWVSQAPFPEAGDGLLTDRAELVLGIYTADCVPLFLYSKSAGVVGVVHIGWRGLASGIVGSLFALFSEHNVPASQCLFFLGPAIQSCCYEVDEPVLSRLRPLFPHIPRGRAFIDLKTLIRESLAKHGVPKEAITVSPYCTSCYPNLFYSYRREKTKKRHLGSICLLPTD